MTNYNLTLFQLSYQGVMKNVINKAYRYFSCVETPFDSLLSLLRRSLPLAATRTDAHRYRPSAFEVASATQKPSSCVTSSPLGAIIGRLKSARKEAATPTRGAGTQRRVTCHGRRLSVHWRAIDSTRGVGDESHIAKGETS